jgi:26S proteasome regulatory subunit N8
MKSSEKQNEELSLLDTKEEEPLGVKIHPIALLSIVDHFERTVGAKKNKRALGVLLGEDNNGIFDVTNSYAIPFDEDPKMEGVFYLDHNYHETMFNMFKKINIKEQVLGWYVTGSSFKPHDLEINEIFSGYNKKSILITCDVNSKKEFDLPTKAFYAVEYVDNEGYIQRSFKSIACKVEAFEPEEVGVEHLIRELKDLNMDSLQNKLQNKVQSLVALRGKISTISQYLEDVSTGRRKSDQQITFALQRIMAKLPKVLSTEMKNALAAKVNENYLNLYVAGIVKSVIAIHNLLNNRIRPLEDFEEKLKAEKEKKKIKQETAENKEKDEQKK